MIEKYKQKLIEFLIKLGQDLELSVETSLNKNYQIKFFIWLKIYVIYLISKVNKDEITESFFRKYIDPRVFYRREFVPVRLISLLRTERYEAKTLGTHDKVRWAALVKWATAPPGPVGGWHLRGFLKGPLINSPNLSYRNPIHVQIEKFCKEEFSSYKDVRNFWEEKNLHYPNERWLYKKVLESVDKEEEKIEKLIENRKYWDKSTTGKNLLEII